MGLININFKQAAGNVGNNALNAAARFGIGAVSMRIFDAIASPIDSFIDCLRTEGGLSTNNVILCTDKGIAIEFIDAKIDVKKQNTLIETTLVNRSGKVRERIQADDYIVKIAGNLIGGCDRFPYSALVLLNKILNEARSISVASAYLYAFGITRLALKSADFKQSDLKAFNAMPFLLEFVSDRNYGFEVK